MLLGDGDGFVKCACGHRHWGLHGAAGLLLTDPERGVLLQRRAWWVHHGRTWALPGGAIRSTETAREAAIREAAEEAAVPEEAVHLTSKSIVDHGTWSYTTVLGSTRRRVEEKAISSESAGLRWVPPDQVQDYPLHRDFAKAWPALRAQLDRRLVLVVDAANVVGSRPDGWWKDRAGATGRLRDQLAALVRAGVPAVHDGLPADAHWSWWPRIVLVVEGRARGIESGEGVEVVAAERDGDSAIIAVAKGARSARGGDHVVVVTADRELRARAEAEGAGHLGPAALLSMVHEQAS
ncbi:MAG: NUDIX domain-containing protein [Haloechinothrix sp.]